MDPGRGGYTLEPQGMPLQPFFNVGWGPRKPFGPAHGFGPGVIANIPEYRDTWGTPDMDAHPIAPPMLCPTQCPTPVSVAFCHPQKRGDWGSDVDPWGDPKELVPPGVRTDPSWTPVGVKNATGGKALVGPDGANVFPSPMLPAAPRGLPLAAGELVGASGAVTDSGAAGGGLFARIPWWGWAIGAVVAVKMLGGRR